MRIIPETWPWFPNPADDDVRRPRMFAEVVGIGSNIELKGRSKSLMRCWSRSPNVSIEVFCDEEDVSAKMYESDMWSERHQSELEACNCSSDESCFTRHIKHYYHREFEQKSAQHIKNPKTTHYLLAIITSHLKIGQEDIFNANQLCHQSQIPPK